AISSFSTSFYLLDKDIIKGKLPVRKKFSHKGTYGHCLLIAGSSGKAGAAILASEACLRGGAGLLTVHLPKSIVPIIQVAVPEAMCSYDFSDDIFTGLSDCSSYSAVGIGPGIGKKDKTVEALRNLLIMHPHKMVLDADALNILSENRDMLNILPENAILTPHPKEFERLAGKCNDSWSRLCLLRDFSSEYKVIVVLKGAYTSIAFPNGDVWFNTTGNPGMATAGSGDVLTGLILGLLSQNISLKDAALLGVYLHGFAGDLAAKEIGQESMISGDIIRYLGKSFLSIRK
ncbi:MAG: NAD(P)H-hydrate dehydratase, partial [Prolixibacteraceae bacterium]|nr:NAD(P)H-hydrate dehydratase [Prolixibacteraceae bacterium]